jgi:hypothetical protein
VSQQQKARISKLDRIDIALVFGTIIGIGAGFGLGLTMDSVVLGTALGIAIFLLFGLEFSQ